MPGQDWRLLTKEELAEIGHRWEDGIPPWSYTAKTVRSLQDDMGRLLAHIEVQEKHLERLEAVAEAAKELRQAILQGKRYQSLASASALDNAEDRLFKALDALEEGEKTMAKRD